MTRPMNITEKILAAHTNLDSVAPGDLISAQVDLALANDITAPLAIDVCREIGVEKVFDDERKKYHIEKTSWERKRDALRNNNAPAAEDVQETEKDLRGAESLEKACEQFRDAGCDLIVLYCIGFNQKLGGRVRTLCNRPVLVSSTMVARFIGELAA